MAEQQDDIQQLDFYQAMSDFRTMFPTMDDEIIEAVLRANNGAVDSTIDQLLTMAIPDEDADGAAQDTISSTQQPAANTAVYANLDVANNLTKSSMRSSHNSPATTGYGKFSSMRQIKEEPNDEEIFFKSPRAKDYNVKSDLSRWDAPPKTTVTVENDQDELFDGLLIDAPIDVLRNMGHLGSGKNSPHHEMEKVTPVASHIPEVKPAAPRPVAHHSSRSRSLSVPGAHPCGTSPVWRLYDKEKKNILLGELPEDFLRIQNISETSTTSYNLSRRRSEQPKPSSSMLSPHHPQHHRSHHHHHHRHNHTECSAAQPQLGLPMHLSNNAAAQQSSSPSHSPSLPTAVLTPKKKSKSKKQTESSVIAIEPRNIALQPSRAVNLMPGSHGNLTAAKVKSQSPKESTSKVKTDSKVKSSPSAKKSSKKTSDAQPAGMVLSSSPHTPSIHPPTHSHGSTGPNPSNTSFYPPRPGMSPSNSPSHPQRQGPSPSSSPWYPSRQGPSPNSSPLNSQRTGRGLRSAWEEEEAQIREDEYLAMVLQNQEFLQEISRDTEIMQSLQQDKLDTSFIVQSPEPLFDEEGRPRPDQFQGYGDDSDVTLGAFPFDRAVSNSQADIQQHVKGMGPTSKDRIKSAAKRFFSRKKKSNHPRQTYPNNIHQQQSTNHFSAGAVVQDS